MAGPCKPTNANRSPSISKKSPPMPTEQDLVTFDHVAAGHEGISSNASGSLVIKPCTQAEIDFYESARDHEAFQAHMPTYMGALTLNQEQVPADSIIPLLAQVGQVIAGNTANRRSTSSLLPIGELLSSISHPLTSSTVADAAITAVSAKRASWKPSGGKKLQTGMAVVLENVAAGFRHPNILDVKLGARLWADDAPASKRRKLDDVSKETTSASLGFRIAGMKIWNGAEQQDKSEREIGKEAAIEIKDGYKVYNKYYGRAFSRDNVKDGIAEYLGGTIEDEARAGKKRLRRTRGRLIAKRMVRELENMQYVLEHEESRMYSASVLMVYEGSEEAVEDALRDEEMRQTAAEENAARDSDKSFETAGSGRSSEEDEAGELDGDDGEDDDEDEEEPPKVLDVRLIDFAHAEWTPGLGPDENSLQGIKSMIGILRELAVE